MTYPNAIFSAFAFLGFLMCAVPLPWHLKAWNTGTCLYMIWTALSCLNLFINSIIWNRNIINWAPVWCDISGRFIIGSSVAIPAASLCINRRLYHISSVRYVTRNQSEKCRDIMVDLSIGLGIPLIEMVLQYIVQGHRFNIYEDVGCYPFTYNTWPAYILVFCAPIVIGLFSACYAIRSIILFNRSRTQFNDLLSGYSNLTSSRYVRLMCLAGVEVLCTVPLASFAVYLNGSHHQVRPWISWYDTHYDFSRVDQIPSMVWRSTTTSEMGIELTRWLSIFCAVLFFTFFGFSDEARKNYRRAIQSVANLKRMGITILRASPAGSKTKIPLVRPLPLSHVHSDFLRPHNSTNSFTNASLSKHDVSGHFDQKEINEKDEVFSPTHSYGGITLNDVGGTLVIDGLSPPSYSPPSGSSSVSSSLTIPEPAITRSSSIASSPSPSSPTDEPSPKANTPDIV